MYIFEKDEKDDTSMPIKIEEEIYKSVKKAHPNYSEARAKGETFKIMNKQRMLHRRSKSVRKKKSSKK